MIRDNDQFTLHLRQLRSALELCGEHSLVKRLDDVMAMPSDEREAFLTSNELWGGSGSIADEGGIGCGRSLRGKVESALIQLGEEQLRTGRVNRRTATWVEAFKRWRQEGA